MAKTTSSYVKRSMQDDEIVRYVAELHWIIYKTGFFFLFSGGLIGHYIPNLMLEYLGKDIAGLAEKPITWFALFLVGVGTLFLINEFIRQISTELVITDQRVIAKHGLISCTSYELMMSKVEGATIDQSVLGRILGYGTLMVKGTGGGISPIDHVAKPFYFHAALMDAIQEAHEGDGNRRYVHD